MNQELLDKVILLHTTKTGGTSIRRNFKLKDFGRKHSPVSQIEEMEKRTIDDFIKDGFKVVLTVRNPYERIISMYNHFGKNRFKTIDEFIESLKKDSPKKSKNRRRNLLAPQSEYFHKEAFIIKHENYDKLVKEFFESEDYGVEVNGPIRNVNKSRVIFNGELSKEQKEKVYSFYKEDFLKFKYKK